MPLATKLNGYPIEDKVAAASTVMPAVPNVQTQAEPKKLRPSSGTEPTLKDRSIVNQTAWKVAGNVAAGYAGNPDQWFEIASKLQKKVEAQMLSIYTGEEDK